MAQAMIDDGLPDICISHPTEWGLPVRASGFADQVIYVWFEMAAGYLFAGANSLFPQESDVFVGAQRAFSQESQIAHVYGFDNAYYHTLLFPAIFFALDLDLKPPTYHIVNELLDLEGQKFSTSRNHAIWGKDFLNAMGSDRARLALCMHRPQGRKENFIPGEVANESNRIFVQELNGWVRGVIDMLRPHQNALPEPGAWLTEHRQYFNKLLVLQSTTFNGLSHTCFAPHESARALVSFIEDSRRFVESQLFLIRSSAGAANYLRTASALAVLGLFNFANASAPILTEFSESVLSCFGSKTVPPEGSNFLPAGTSIDFASLTMFAHIEWSGSSNPM